MLVSYFFRNQDSEMSVKDRQKKREPLDMTNKAYDELIEARKNGQTLPVDYINANIVSSRFSKFPIEFLLYPFPNKDLNTVN